MIHLPFLKLFIIIFRDIKMRPWSWPANSIEPQVRLHGYTQTSFSFWNQFLSSRCSGWPDSILVVKANHFRFQQDKVPKMIMNSSKNGMWIVSFKKFSRFKYFYGKPGGRFIIKRIFWKKLSSIITETA